MQLSDFTAWAREHHGWNDIELWDEEREDTGGLIEQPIPDLVGFAEHGSGSVYALWKGHVVWLDSEGEQFLLAKSVDEFVDAMHLYAGSLWDLASAGQREEAPDLDELREEFDQAWIAEARESAREANPEAYEAFTTWAASQGRGAPAYIVDRLAALRPMALKLRKLAVTAAGG